MTDEKYFELMLELVNCEGWETFVEEFTKDSRASVLDHTSAASFWQAKGKEQAYSKLKKFEETVRDA